MPISHHTSNIFQRSHPTCCGLNFIKPVYRNGNPTKPRRWFPVGPCPSRCELISRHLNWNSTRHHRIQFTGIRRRQQPLHSNNNNNGNDTIYRKNQTQSRGRDFRLSRPKKASVPLTVGIQFPRRTNRPVRPTDELALSLVSRRQTVGTDDVM